MGATINGVGRSIDHWQLDSSVFFNCLFVNKDMFLTNLNTDLYHVRGAPLKKKKKKKKIMDHTGYNLLACPKAVSNVVPAWNPTLGHTK